MDLAKSVFEVAVANERGQIFERKRLGRASFRRLLATRPSSRVVMEACGTAHHWGRVAQQQGHRVTLLPPQHVRPFVRRNKTDRADAEAAPGSDPGGHLPFSLRLGRLRSAHHRLLRTRAFVEWDAVTCAC